MAVVLDIDPGFAAVQGLASDYDALRAENIQLRQYAADHWAQIERLRAALDEIAALGNGPLGEIARDALANTKRA